MKPAQGDQWPEARAVHSACPLNYGEEHSTVLVSGGVDKGDDVLGDMWILDVDSGKWTEVRMLDYKFLCDFRLEFDRNSLYNYHMHSRGQLSLFVNYSSVSC